MPYSIPSQPKQVRLELTNRCNAHCVTCHRLTMIRSLGDMEVELLEKCLADIKLFPEPLYEIVPSNYGESFMARDWRRKLQAISKRLPQTRMVIPTNGSLLTSEVVGELCQIPTLKLVNLSVNAYSPEIYTYFHKLDSKHLETIKSATKKIRELRHDVTLWISIVLDSQIQSPREIDLFIEEWSKIGIVQTNLAQYNNRPDRAPFIPVKFPCRSLFNDLVVNYDGRVTSCCFDADCQIVVGDAKKDNLLDIWHGKKFTDLRRLHNEGKRASLEICKGCTFA